VALFYLTDNVSGIFALLGSELADEFKVVVFGSRAEDVMTAFGLTQFAAIYISTGLIGLILGSFLFSFISVQLYRVILTSKYLSPLLIKALTPILAIFFVKMMLAGGGLLLYVKEILVVVSLAFTLSQLFMKKSPKAANGCAHDTYL
jgi:hypothetical protein